MEKKLHFTTDYSQFYICDKGSPKDTGSDSFWTEEAYRDRLAVGKGILGVLIESYDEVRCDLEIAETDPKVDLTYCEHTVEGSLEIPSGTLQVLDCLNRTVEFETSLTPGIYRIRILSFHISSAEEAQNDFYKVQIWKEKSLREREVTKRFKRINR